MKNNLIKRVGALALAAVMTMGMSASVFASSADLGEDKSLVDDSTVISKAGVNQNGTGVDSDNDGTNESATYTAVGNTISIDKEIVIFNTNTSGTVVYLPNITYNYTIAPATVASDKHITDEFGISGTIYSGDLKNNTALQTTSASVVYANTTNTNGITDGTDNNITYVKTNDDGIAARGSFDIRFDPTKYPHAGVYRYLITEIADNRQTAAVVNNNYNNTRYLDVYVKNSDSGDTLEIYGYVLFEGTADSEFGALNSGVAEKTKTNGFVSDKYDTEGQEYSNTEEDVDIYNTANLKIEKQVSGALADKTNEFPFQAVITTNATANPIISYVYDEEENAPNGSNVVETTKTLSNGVGKIGAANATTADIFTLKHNDYIYIYGIPYNQVTAVANNGTTTAVDTGASVVVTEYNNTTDTYAPTATYNDTTTMLSNTTLTATNTVNTTATLNVKKTTEDVLIVTNSLDAVSPTNVVLRFAPFIIMAAFALVLFVVFRRQRDEKHSDMI